MSSNKKSKPFPSQPQHPPHHNVSSSSLLFFIVIFVFPSLLFYFHSRVASCSTFSFTFKWEREEGSFSFGSTPMEMDLPSLIRDPCVRPFQSYSTGSLARRLTTSFTENH
ncbi:hypothetical protein HMI55_004070 [Coelomomyces lativittatus]|nr:hypothetical protein HMI55_004070 [Coelomomyces lativittatus]